MSPLDLLRFAGGALLGHRLRSGLSLLGVAIGVTAVLLLTSLGEGARRYVTGEFAALGTNLLIVVPGRTETAGALPGIGRPASDLTLADADAIRRQVPHVRRTVPMVMGSETVAYRERRRQTMVIGSAEGFLEVRGLTMGPGRFLPPPERHRPQPVAVLGAALARELFPPGVSPLGAAVRVGERRLRVIGVLAPRGVQLGVDLDEVIVIPVATGMQLFDRTSLFRLIVELHSVADLEPAQARIEALLRERHGAEDVTILTQGAVLDAFTTVLGALTAALAAIAAISLAVAGVGIMNVMLVSVSERTAEVGLLKALGATNGQVLAVFLCEAVLLAAAGALVGLAVSAAALVAMRWALPAFPAAPPLWAIGAALGLSLLAGAGFGVLPARRATRLDPVAALARR